MRFFKNDCNVGDGWFYLYIVHWGVLNPHFMKTPPMLPSPFFEILSNPIHFPVFSNPTPTVFSVVLFLWQNEWSRHIWCAILLNDNTDLHMSSLGTLVPEGPWCVFYVTRRQVYWGLTHNVVFTGTLIWYHTHKHTHKAHSGASRLTHPYKYLFTPPVMCWQQLPLLH